MTSALTDNDNLRAKWQRNWSAAEDPWNTTEAGAEWDDRDEQIGEYNEDEDGNESETECEW